MIIDIPMIGSSDRAAWLTGSTNWASGDLANFFNGGTYSLTTASSSFRPSEGDPLTLTIDLQTPLRLKNWTLKQYSDSFPLPQDLKIMGSETGAFSGEEVEIQSFTGLASETTGYIRDHEVSPAQAYQYYQMVITGWTTTNRPYLSGTTFEFQSGEYVLDTDTDYLPVREIKQSDWGYTVHTIDYSDNTERFHAVLCMFVRDLGWDVEILEYGKTFLAKSDGLNGDQPWVYFEINTNSDGYIELVEGYGYWDADNKTGTMKLAKNSRSDYNKLRFNSGTANVICWGNRDFFSLLSPDNVDQSYEAGWLMAGHWSHNPQILPAHTTLTADAVTATGPTLEVANSTGFEVGAYYCVWGAKGEGRDFGVQCTEIVDATHIKVDSVPRDYSTGAFIGNFPMKAFRRANYNYSMAQSNQSGLIEPTTSNYFDDSYVSNVWRDPSKHHSKDILTNYFIHENGGLVAVPDHIMADGRSSNSLQFYLVGVKTPNDTGTVSAATTSTLTDSTQAWTENEHAGRYLFITSGTSYDDKVGNLGKIVSNTADTVTIEGEFLTTPAAGDTFNIASEIWQKGCSNHDPGCFQIGV